MKPRKKELGAGAPNCPSGQDSGHPIPPKSPKGHRRLEGWGAPRPPVPRVLFLSLAAAVEDLEKPCQAGTGST